MKKTFKNFILIGALFLVVLLVLPCFFNSSISARAVNYSGDYICISLQPTSNGNISWGINFGLNTEGRNLQDDEKATYRLNMQIMVHNLQDEIKSKFETIHLANPKEEYKIKSNDFTVPIYDQKTDSVGFKINFHSNEMYAFYMAKAGDKNLVASNIFLSHQTKKSLFPFAELVDTQDGPKTLARYLKNEVVSACQGLSIEQSMLIYDPQFIYDYATFSNRIKSNADFNYKEGDKYHHVWVERFASINNDKQVVVSLIVPITGWWYVFGIGVPLVAMGIAITVVIIKNKKKNKKDCKEIKTA